MNPTLTPISQINRDFVGLKTKISGRIIEIETHSQGHIFLKVKDESGGVISVPIFASVYSDLNEKIELLDHIQTTGQIKNYQGDLELIPKKAKDIQIVHTPPLEISKINQQKVGEKVKIRGFVKEKTSVGSGSLLFELYKKDESITVFIPRSVAKSGNFPKISEDQMIQVSGPVQLYENKLEVQISNPHNLRTVGASR